MRAVRSTLAVAAVAAASLVVPGAAASVAPLATAHSAVTRPTPAVAGHVLAQTLMFPPDTAYCQTNIGISCYSPIQYRKAYDLAPVYSGGITGAGRTIAIVDSFGSPTIVNDLHVFDQNYGIPDPPSLTVISPAGSPPPFDNTDQVQLGWATETTLDVEYAHAIAPGAKILLVTTPVAETEGVEGFPEIVAAENYVIKNHLADVITQSFGATENTFPTRSSLTSLRSAFTAAVSAGITVMASSGDTGSGNYIQDGSALYPNPVNSWPSADPLVTSIGGTMLKLDAAGNKISPDAVWNDGYGAGGGGYSQVFPRPSYQFGVRSVVGSTRGTPDISMSAAVDGAAIFYYSYDPTRVGWHLVGGTSEASPLFSGIVALAAQKAGHSLGAINPAIYALAKTPGAGVVDVTSGTNAFAGIPGYDALPGYDLASGVGTVDAAKFVPALAAYHS